MEVSACYGHMLDTPGVDTLVGTILALLLAPLCDIQLRKISDLVSTEKRRFDEIPQIRDLAKSFLGSALVRGIDPVVASSPILFGESQLYTDRGIATGASRLKLLEKRIVQFNLVKAISVFYSRIRLAKLASILNLSVDDCEMEITELVSSKALQVKIDRPAGIVWFHPRVSPQVKLDQWAGNINRALDLVESTSNLIQKEIMLHSAKEKMRKAVTTA